MFRADTIFILTPMFLLNMKRMHHIFFCLSGALKSLINTDHGVLHNLHN